MTGRSTIDRPVRRRLTITGIVQGVGFRPFVYKLAKEKSLRGFVLNEGGAVVIEIEGCIEDADSFQSDLVEKPPPLARIEKCQLETLTPQGNNSSDFRIVSSSQSVIFDRFISPDAATCDQCLSELFDEHDRRYRYPFLNCTNCGPRFTIIQQFPYDRSRTTMSDFSMCTDCLAEYNNPLSRRFHAQPNACWQCGPQSTLLRNGKAVARGEEALQETTAAIKRGEIAAIKGIGGFHLVCDATDGDVVSRLRQLKGRFQKPLAVMYATTSAVLASYAVPPAAAAEITSHRRPIILLSPEPAGASVAANAAPGLDKVGVMLPYTPLHHLILHDFGGPLIVTSGNRREEPICIENNDAVERLSQICDLFLIHDRSISSRYDDSVMVSSPSYGVLPLRRSRGYAPDPIKVPHSGKTVLAVGGHLKNTFCVLADNKAYVSQHVGDLDNLDALGHFEACLERTLELFELSPDLIACDLHPEYMSTTLARSLALKMSLEITPVQHHHAHVASCAAEHGVVGPFLGLALDGSGYGNDGSIWGGEFLLCASGAFSRVACFEQVALPGGTAAIKNPWRMALSFLDGEENESRIFCQRLSSHVDTSTISGVLKLLQSNTLNMKTSSCGRLFDAVAAVVAMPADVTYEGQAAMQLEALARRSGGTWSSRSTTNQTFDIDHSFNISASPSVMRTRPLVLEAMRQVTKGSAPELVAWRFHASLSRLLANTLQALCAFHDIGTVCLSGGVFQNMLLLELLLNDLKDSGVNILIPKQLPCNDGGISLGQSVVAGSL